MLGELDIVAVDGRTVVFVEVKTRASQEAGHPSEAVDRDKQRCLFAWPSRICGGMNCSITRPASTLWP